MSRIIPASQLVLNGEGVVYHLNLHPEHLADNVILVGDPGRAEMVASFFDTVEVVRDNRELHTRTGMFNGVRFTVISTGMGVDNIDIVMNELDILANVNLSTREVKERRRSLNIVRIGTCGALQPEIETGESVASRYALGLDGLIYFYAGHEKVNNTQMRDAFIAHTQYPADLPTPYIIECSKALLDKVGKGFKQGITATSPGFYGPQGRQVSLVPAYSELNSKIESFSFGEWKICNFEMESSALFGLGGLMGHNCLTICLVIANRVTEKFVSDYHDDMKKLIARTLENMSEK